MEAQHPQGNHESETTKVAGETTDCGMFDFLKKKGEDTQAKKEEEKPTLKEKLHRSRSNSSSSSDEGDQGEGEKKKKKGLKEKIKKNISRGKEEEDTGHKDMSIPVEKHDQIASGEGTHPEEKKGILEKIKEKLPGQHKKAEEDVSAGSAAAANSPEGEPKEKKGILVKIKEKLPGCHKNEEEGKED